MLNSNPTQRLTVGQAVVQFLAAQRVERDGDTQPVFGGAIGIFGHGNVAGIGQALLQYRKDFRLYQARNEQGMVHMATGYAKAKNRLEWTEPDEQRPLTKRGRREAGALA